MVSYWRHLWHQMAPPYIDIKPTEAFITESLASISERCYSTIRTSVTSTPLAATIRSNCPYQSLIGNQPPIPLPPAEPKRGCR